MARSEKYTLYCGLGDLSEAEFKDRWKDKLEKYFYVDTEVIGTHLSGDKMKIDAIITPKDTTDWKNKAFGVEFKSPAKADVLKSKLSFMKQCIDYSYTNFKGYGFIPILGCPGFEIDEGYSNEESLTAFKCFLNTFHIGELYDTNSGMGIFFKEVHCVWLEGEVLDGKIDEDRSETFEKNSNNYRRSMSIRDSKKMEKYSNLCDSRNLSENEFSHFWENKLKEFFYIKKQVKGKHLSGKKMKIDAVITPKDTTDWKNKEIAFGINFKLPKKLEDLHSLISLMGEYVDYSNTKFEGYGFIPILACTAFEVDYTYSDRRTLTAFRHFMNVFNIGEICQIYRGLTIAFAENYIWNDGVAEGGKRWLFKKKFGHK